MAVAKRKSVASKAKKKPATKKRKVADAKFDPNKAHTVAEASKVVKDITTTKFDASVDLAIRLGVDPRKANQMVRGTVTLPHGTGKVFAFWQSLLLIRKRKLKQQVLTTLD